MILLCTICFIIFVFIETNNKKTIALYMNRESNTQPYVYDFFLYSLMNLLSMVYLVFFFFETGSMFFIILIILRLLNKHSIRMLKRINYLTISISLLIIIDIIRNKYYTIADFVLLIMQTLNIKDFKI